LRLKVFRVAEFESEVQNSKYKKRIQYDNFRTYEISTCLSAKIAISILNIFTNNGPYHKNHYLFGFSTYFRITNKLICIDFFWHFY